MTGTELNRANFDRIARPYRWLEYITLGNALENCRRRYLSQLLDRRNALVLGDGDGRFTCKLLTANPDIAVVAIDISATMLQLLRQRCEASTHDANTRLHTHQANALTFPLEGSYDLIVTHFFLDCLTQSQLDSLIARLTPHLRPKTLWLLSDFRVPTGLMRLPARFFIRTLYLAFRLLTGLRTTRLPDFATSLNRAGLLPAVQHTSLFGLLTTELWQLSDSPTDPTLIAMTSTDSTRNDHPDKPDTPQPPDPIPDPEPAAPPLDQPDPGVFHHDPKPQG
jgi:SAM-dependent methyltransferase